MTSLIRFYNDNLGANNNKYEICIDEAGRGCLFGRVYIACVVLPKDPELFSSKDIKDSKKFSSKKKINEVATYIKANALAWSISYIERDVIDDINILQAVMRGMHNVINNTIKTLYEKNGSNINTNDFFPLVDGNYFIPYLHFDHSTESIIELPYATIEKGDSLYMGIAAASILAKTARDQYILDMCMEHPDLSDKYGLEKNMGYGTKLHLDGIKQHGITQWHRKTFGICREFSSNIIDK